MKKQTAPLRSSKKDMLKEKNNLPKEKPAPLEVTPPDAEPKVNSDRSKATPPDAEPKVEIDTILENMKSTGVIRAMGCNGFNLLLVKRKRMPLTPEQYRLLGEPLDKIESEVIKLLPEWLKDQLEKNGPLAGAIIETATLAIVIWKLNELPKVTSEKSEVTPPDAEPKVKIN